MAELNSKTDCEQLINALLPLAEEMLKEYGEFYPYGGYLKPDGEIVHVGAKDEDTDDPKSKDLLYILRDSFTQIAKTGDCKATGIVFDVRVTIPGVGKKSDAIEVSLEHVDGYSAEVFFPYKIDEGRVIYGATFAQEGEHRIFGKA